MKHSNGINSVVSHDYGKEKVFDVVVYLYPERHRVVAKNKEEALDKIMGIMEFPFDEMDAEEVLKDKDSCEEHFDFDAKCQACSKKLNENVENAN